MLGGGEREQATVERKVGLVRLVSPTPSNLASSARFHAALAPLSPSSVLGAPSNVAALHVHAFGPAAFEGTALLPWSDSTTDWRRHPPSRSRLHARPCCFTTDGKRQRTLGAMPTRFFHPLLRATARSHRNQAFGFPTVMQIGVQASASMWSSIRHRTS